MGAPDRTIQLQHPVEIRATDTGEVVETVTHLALRRPTARDLRAMDKAQGEVGKSIALLATLARVPPSTIELLDAADYLAAAEVLADVLGKPPGTGAS
jgi:hypothetical protein